KERRKTKTAERKAKESREIITEVKNLEKSLQTTFTKENEEILNPFVQAIGYDYSRLNNPKQLNGEVRLSLEYITYAEGKDPQATIIVEEKENNNWIKVTKLLKNYSGLSEDLTKHYREQ